MSTARDIIRFPPPLRLKHRIEDDEVVIQGQRGTYAEAKRMALAILADLDLTDLDQAKTVILARLAQEPRTVADLEADANLGPEDLKHLVHGLTCQRLIRRLAKPVSWRKGQPLYEITPKGVHALAGIMIDQFGLA